MSETNDTAPSASVANAGSTFRALIIALGGWLIGRGYLSADLVHAATPVVLIAGPLIWAYFTNHKTKTLIQKAIDAPSGSAG